MNEKNGASRETKELENRDPITGTPGAHPAGVGVGAAAGGAAGAAIGAVGGPVGSLIGAGIGAIAGGLTGKAIAEEIDPTIEEAYWKVNYRYRPYVDPDRPYDAYAPAYRYGWEAAGRYPGRRFVDVESELARDWDKQARGSTLPWPQAGEAARDAWNRVLAERKKS